MRPITVVSFLVFRFLTVPSDVEELQAGGGVDKHDASVGHPDRRAND